MKEKAKPKIYTRKIRAFEEWDAIREVLQNRLRFRTDEAHKIMRSLLGREITHDRLRSMIQALYAKYKMIRPVRDAKGGKFQTYEILHRDLSVIPPKGVDIKQKKLPMEEIKQGPIEEEKQEPEVLTLADVERIGEMDLAFIGYTIRTESEILSRKFEASLIQVKTAQEELMKLTKERDEMKKTHMAEIQTLIKHHQQEVESFKKKLEASKDHESTIRNLNNRITNLNLVNTNLKKDVERLEKIVNKGKVGDKTFKLSEVATFTNQKGKPSHLA